MKNVLIFIVLSAGWCFSPAAAFAQTAGPQFLLTWRAATYAPPAFQGKTLPTAGSLITASFELIDRGSPADLSDQTIYWYVGGDIVSKSPGNQRIRFAAPKTAEPIDLRVELPDYNGASLLKTVTIPVVPPEVVVEAPFPRGVVSALSFRVRALPYFFNVKNVGALSLSWTANGQPAQGSDHPDALDVAPDPAMPNGSSIAVTLNARNPFNALESAQKTVTVLFQK